MLRTLCALLLLAVPAAAADLSAVVASDAKVEKLVGECKFTEGPAYSPQGFLLFSDIPNNRIVRRDDDGKVTDYLNPSGQANGLVFDAAGHLYACQGGARRVVKINAVDGKIEVLADKYDGKKINSPNDLALDGQGGLYFTDPRYGSNEGVEQTVMGVYYVSADGKVSRVIEGLPRPNGILVTPNGKSLIVANPNVREIRSYPITGPGKIGEGKVIFTGDEQLDGGGPDGMAHDADGRIYATYKTIVVLSAYGDLIGRIDVPEKPANCTFGGKDGKTLFITARTSLYGVAMKVAGAPLASHGPKPAPQVSDTRLPKSSETSEVSRSQVPIRLVRFTQAEAKEVKIEDITLQAPANWKQEPPANKLRLGQFQIPAAEGDKEPAGLVISFFGGDGGGVAENLKRWNGEFTGDDKQVKVTQGTSSQGRYIFNELSGTFLKPIGPPIAGRKEPTPGYRSLNVILEVKDKGNYFLKLTGPDKTVKAAADGFRASFGADASKETPYEMK
jgi:gluconolactonase